MVTFECVLIQSAIQTVTLVCYALCETRRIVHDFFCSQSIGDGFIFSVDCIIDRVAIIPMVLAVEMFINNFGLVQTLDPLSLVIVTT